MMSRLEQIRRIKDATAPSGKSRSRLVAVGHSFGGAVLATGLRQLLENRFVETAGGGAVQSDVAGFGDLVVLVNPAFEGLLLSPLSDMAAERRSYFGSQLPALAVLTSEADLATRYAFPAGRRLSTVFQKERHVQRWNATTERWETIDEEEANVTAVGHFAPYRTHWLYPSDDRPRKMVVEMSSGEMVRAFLRSSDAWVDDVPGSRIQFGGLILERTPTSAGRNPYLMIQVDRRLIRDHNDIDDPRVIDFLKQIILVSTHTSDEAAHMGRMITGAP
jgi:hypothetical protein